MLLLWEPLRLKQLTEPAEGTEAQTASTEDIGGPIMLGAVTLSPPLSPILDISPGDHLGQEEERKACWVLLPLSSL